MISGTWKPDSTFRRRWIVAAEADMDEERIMRIARAMCRAARLDPDKPAGNAGPYTMSMRKPGHEMPQPAWMLFRREAALFASRHRDVAVRL